MAQHSATTSRVDVVVVGAACLDIKARLRSDTLAGTSNAGEVLLSVGGGARNVAENLARLGMSVALLSVVCEDDFGQTIIRQTQRAGVQTDHILRVCEQHSAAYVALLGSSGQLLVGVDDTLAAAAITPEYIADHAEMLRAARTVVLDANVPTESAQAIIAICGDADVPIVLDPIAYSPALRYRPYMGAFALVVPNEIEAQALTDIRITSEAQAVAAAQQLVAEGVDIAIITRADAGVIYASGDVIGNVPALSVDIVDPTGAGDALTAAVVYALLQNIPLDEAVRLGVSAATLTLASTETVRQDLSLESLYAQLVL